MLEGMVSAKGVVDRKTQSCFDTRVKGAPAGEQSLADAKPAGDEAVAAVFAAQHASEDACAK
eukprot:4088097-Pyramimonas_sp.AAC.1